MGALALYVAKIARRRQHALPRRVNGYLPKWEELQPNWATVPKRSYCRTIWKRPPEPSEEDDAMDDLHRHLFTVLMDREWKLRSGGRR